MADARDWKRNLADRLAASLKDSTTLPLLQLLSNGKPAVNLQHAARAHGPFSSLHEDARTLLKHGARADAVSIWIQDAEAGGFVRSEAHRHLWRFCANRERIPPKGARKRVVLLGESAARGFFYDPFYSPAQVLESILIRAGIEAEVIDLAQSNIDAWWLSSVAGTVSVLEPDAILVMAGNNWRPGALANFSGAQCASVGASLGGEGGLTELLARQAEQLRSLTTDTVRQLSLAAADAGAPLVIMIPEVNVADWTNCPVNTLDVPPMSSSELRRWRAAYASARIALARGDLAVAQAEAQTSIEIDQGICSASFELLGSIQQARGEVAAAASSLRRAREASVSYLDGTCPVPGVWQVAAEALRAVSAEVQARVVDLPAVFESQFPGEMPGGRLFLDYCHMTSEGIRLAMAAAAREVLRIWREGPERLTDLLAMAPAPEPEQEAWAHVLAGVHNSHWGQTVESCARHFKQAIQCHPRIHETALRPLYEAVGRQASPLLCEPFVNLVANEAAANYLVGYGGNFRTVGPISEHRLQIAMRTACPELCALGFDADFTLGPLPELDLLQSRWRDLTDGNRWHRRAYIAAYDTTSRFHFAVDEARALSVRIVGRVPGATEVGELKVELNGHHLQTVPVSSEWGRVRVDVDPIQVRAGMNELAIHWPDVEREHWRAQLRRDFEAHRLLDLRCHFGHLHELRVGLS